MRETTMYSVRKPLFSFSSCVDKWRERGRDTKTDKHARQILGLEPGVNTDSHGEHLKWHKVTYPV